MSNYNIITDKNKEKQTNNIMKIILSVLSINTILFLLLLAIEIHIIVGYKYKIDRILNDLYKVTDIQKTLNQVNTLYNIVIPVIPELHYFINKTLSCVGEYCPSF